MTRKKSRIPKFSSTEKEAEFWDTHEFTEYEDEFKPARVRMGKPLEHIFSVRFDSRTLAELEAQAEKKGTGTATLIRMLVKEGLEDLRSRPSHL